MLVSSIMGVGLKVFHKILLIAIIFITLVCLVNTSWYLLLKFPPRFIRDNKYTLISNLRKNPLFYYSYYNFFVQPISFIVPKIRAELELPMNFWPVKYVKLEPDIEYFIFSGVVKSITQGKPDIPSKREGGYIKLRNIDVKLSSGEDSKIVFSNAYSRCFAKSGYDENRLTFKYDRCDIDSLRIGDRILIYDSLNKDVDMIDFIYII